jgi:hypothetical protein
MSLQKLVSLHKEQADLESAWYRQLLTLASGGLALLVGLGPSVPTGIGKFFLAGTWVFLGLGIVLGAAATYLDVDRATKLKNQYGAELQKSILEHGRAVVTSIVVASPSKLLLWSKVAMVVCLLLAVSCLVTFSVLKTLSA